MKTFFFIVALLFFATSVFSQDPTVKIKLNDEERFRFEGDRLEIVNPLHNVLIGDSCGWSINGNPDAINNVFIGLKAGYNNNTGCDNIFIGDSSGYDNTSGYQNAAVGSWSAWKNTSGRSNAFFGTASGVNNTTGSYNSYFGNLSGFYNDTGTNNCFHGNEAGAYSSGSNNVFLGGSAGRHNKGDSSVMIGFRAGQNDTTSNKLYISNSETDKPLIYGEFDKQLLRFHARRLEMWNDQENTILGDSAGTNTTGDRNTFVGYRSGFSNTSGNDNVFIGDSSGYENTTGHYNVIMGNWAGWKNTIGARNVFLGTSAGLLNTEGWGNVFVGCQAGDASTTGEYNVFLGHTAGSENTTGMRNTFVGLSAGGYNTTGSYNTYIGRTAGFYNETGDSCVFIGNEAGFNEMGSNKLYIANSDTTTPLIYGEFDNELLRVHGTLDIKGLYQFPPTDGSTGQFLKTDGGGIVSWSEAHGDFANGGEAGGAGRSLGNTDNYDLGFLTNNVTRLNIKNDGGIRLDGNLGIFTDPASPGINKSIKLYDSEIYSNPYLKISGHNTASIYLESRRTGATSGKTWSIASGSGSDTDLDKFSIYNPDDGYCFTIRDGGNVGIGGTTNPTAKLDISSLTGYNQVRMRTSYTPTETGDTNGNTGDIAWDDDYVYIKTSTGWKRTSLSTF